jgi:hypothetical protein
VAGRKAGKLPGLLKQAGITAATPDPGHAAGIAAAPEIVAVGARLLARPGPAKRTGSRERRQRPGPAGL